MNAPRNLTRQECIDTACAVGIVAVLLILLGFWFGSSAQPAAAATSAAVSAQQAPIVAPAATLHSDSPEVTTAAAPAPSPVARCEEDMPCWDCRTMGNGICGTVEPAVTAIEPGVDDAAAADEGEQLTAAELAELGATMQPCAFDEGEGPACYWDATTRGNKRGVSFIWTGADLIYASK